MLEANWSDVLKSDLDKLSQLTASSPKKAQVRLKEGERRTVTILFLDIQGFTAMSEKLDPEDVQLIIDNCFKILTNEIEKYQGYIDKYEGDRMMALFGSRQASDQDCENALRAALGMQEKFNEINRILAQREIKIGIRVGVNSGLVVTGRIGKGRDQDFTVMGDAVNLASRLETAAPTNQIMISDSVKKAAGDGFLYENLGNITVKGKSQPISVFCVKGLNPNRAERWERSPFTKRSGYVRRKTEEDLLKKTATQLSRQGEGLVGVAFSAPAGVGKSRLIHEFIRPYQQNKKGGMGIVLKSNIAALQAQPLVLFQDVFRKMLANEEFGQFLFDVSDEVKENVTRLKPVIQYVAGNAEADERMKTLEPKALKLEIQLAIRYAFERLATFAKKKNEKLLMIVLEDLQLMDSASQEALEFLAENFPKDFPIFFLFTYRPSFQPSAGFQTVFNLQEVRLTPLSDKDCKGILRNVLGPTSLTAKEQLLLVRRSGGNPFFMEELIQSLVDEGILKRREDDSWEITRLIEEATLPETVNLILLGRIDRLSPDTKEVLMTMAVVGESVPLKVLFNVASHMGLQDASIEEYLSTLEELGFIFRRKEEGALGKEVAFRHALTQEVVYSTLLNHNKKILHELVGKAFEKVYGDPLDIHAMLLYQHFSNAGMEEKAIHYGMTGVDQLVRQCAPREALQLILDLRKVLASTLESPENFKRDVRLREFEVKVYDFLGQRKDQLRCIQELEDIAKLNPEKKLKARISSFWAMYLVALGKFKEAKEHAERGLEEMGEKGQESSLRMDLTRTLGIACYSVGDYPCALNHYAEGLRISEVLGEDSARGDFLNVIGLVYFNMGKPHEALSYYQQSHEIVTKIGNRRSEGVSLGNQGLVHWTLGNYSEALALLRKSHNIFREIGFRKNQAATIGNIGVIHHKLGQYEEALKCYEQAIDLRQDIRDRAGEGYDLVNIGVAYLHLGEYERALEHFSSGEKIAREVGSNYLLSENLNNLSVIYRKRGESDSGCLKKAIEFASEALAIGREQKLVSARVKALSSLARSFFIQGESEKALAHSEEALSLVKENPQGVEGSEEDAYINHYHILKELGRAEEAKEILRTMVHLIESRASQIKEEAYRESFLNSVRQNRYAMREWRGLKDSD